jgi:hypothetical protein
MALDETAAATIMHPQVDQTGEARMVDQETVGGDPTVVF